MFKKPLSIIIALAVYSVSAHAQSADTLTVHHPYAVSSGAMAMAGAAFMVIHNNSDEDRRLLAASSDVAARVELHTNIEDENGVMRMMRIEGGIPVVAGGMAELARGADHIMLMGVGSEYEIGTEFPLTLEFDDGTEILVQVEVMAANAGGGHGAMEEHMSHGEDGHSEHHSAHDH